MKKSTGLHPTTILINKKQKNLAKTKQYATLNWLAHKFPEAFLNQKQIRPLKHGIREDVLTYASEAINDNISKNQLRKALAIYTRRLDYLVCIKAQEMRIDLFGNSTTKVTKEEAAIATYKIKKNIEKTIKNSNSEIITHNTNKTNKPTIIIKRKLLSKRTYNSQPHNKPVPTII